MANEKKPENPTDPKDITARVRKLEKRALKAIEAWRCCVRGKRQAQKIGVDYINMLQDQLQKQLDDLFTTGFVKPIQPSYVEQLTATPKVGTSGPGPIAGPAAALMIGWVLADKIENAPDVPMPQTQAEVKLVSAHIGVIVETIRRTEEDCLKCVESKIWPQSKKRKWGVWTSTKDGSKNIMRPRFAHK